MRVAAIAIALFSVSACSDNAVAPAPIEGATLTINPPSAVVYEADAIVLSATFRDASGAVVPNAPITWSALDTTRVQLGANGYVLALRNGVVRISATCNGVSASYDLAIVRPAVQNVAVLLPVPVITRGDVAMVGVRVDGPGGRVLTGRAATITSDNANVATVDASGRVRAVSAGVANIRATVDGVSGTSQIQVTADNTIFRLSKFDGNSIPILVAADSVMYEGKKELHEVYLESGSFTLSGTPLRYITELRTAEYNITSVNGRRVMELRYLFTERDRGLITYDNRGDLNLTSEYSYPLSHTASPISGGMQMTYRIAGTDETMNLFFRREPE